MTTEREQILALAHELDFPSLNAWGKDRVVALYHAAIQQYKNSITSLAGEPTYAYRRKPLDYFCTCDKQRYDELSNSSLFDVATFYTADQVLAARKPLEEGVGRLEEERDEAERGPWQEWAELALKIVRKHSGYDGFDDMDGVDLPTELSEALDEYGSEVKQLRKQLAAAQADNERLRESLRFYSDGNHWADGNCHEYGYSQHDPVIERGTVADEALDQQADTSALEAMIAKAGEVMRERCARHLVSGRYMVLDPLRDYTAQQHCDGLRGHNQHQAKAIRALPSVTLEDLK